MSKLTKSSATGNFASPGRHFIGTDAVTGDLHITSVYMQKTNSVYPLWAQAARRTRWCCWAAERVTGCQ